MQNTGTWPRAREAPATIPQPTPQSNPRHNTHRQNSHRRQNATLYGGEMVDPSFAFLLARPLSLHILAIHHGAIQWNYTSP